MKRRMIEALCFMFLTFVGLGSCQSNRLHEFDDAKQGTTPSTSSERIVFTFAAPRGLPTTYMIQDEPEWAIKNNEIHLYEFLAPGGSNSFVKMHTLTLIPEVGQPTYKVEADLSLFSKFPEKNRMFLFVANAPALQGLTSSASLDDVRKKVLGAQQAANQSCKSILLDQKYIPMVGIAETLNNGAYSPYIPLVGSDVKVDLIRAVARIDIRTTMKPSLFNPQLRNLVIKRAVLNKAVNKTAVGNLMLGNSVTNTANNVATFADIPLEGVHPDKTPSGQQHGVPGLLQKAFYLYETSSQMAIDKNMPEVVVTFTYGNDPKEYTVTVPFIQNGVAVDIKRNYLYTIILGPIDDPITQGVAFSIAVNDWDNLVTVTKALNLITPNSSSLPVGFSMDTHTLSLPATGNNSSIEIPFVSQFANSNQRFSASLKDANGHTPDWLRVSANGDKIIIDNIIPNYSGVERTAIILVRDVVASNAYAYNLIVKQASN